MNEPSVIGRLLRRRKWIVTLVIAAVWLSLSAYNLGTYILLSRMGRQLERSLDGRLHSILNLTVQIIERQNVDFSSTTDQALLRLQLKRLRTEHQLEAAYLLDLQDRVLLDSQQDLEGVVSRSYLQKDSTEIRRAQQGGIVISPLHQVAGTHFKNGYGLLLDLYGHAAILVLEANADFIMIMDDFYQALYFGIIISVIMLVLLTFFLITATAQYLRTEGRLNRAERLAALGQMAATVAHEIRNPLAIIKSTTDVLKEKNQRDQTLYGYIEDEVARLNRLVADFLSFAREPELHRTECDLVALINQAVIHHSQEASIRWQPPQALFMISCDSDRIRQVLDNLLLNARQAVGEQKADIAVTLRRQKFRGSLYAQIAVLDNGSGLPEQKRDLFEPFFTTKSSGTGLGLALCKSIVERHGGIIEALARPGGGSEFRFFLPL